ncbi:La-related protein 1 [Vanrija pseudolonga]|uniref:La-related protein 1 n=1 Tax=Vanrija pseudolonga TaxID=143232 RepID=A0AAF1BKA0_9TREE|nr:La-related protein 1 [Vanrija pseudolonga]
MTQSSQSKSTSVFQALGSYADRIKDQPNGSSKASSSSSTPASAVANSSKKANNRTGAARPASPAPAQSRADADAEDGPWETVRTGRNRTKPERQQPQDEKRASNSRNWRERDDKATDSKDKAADVERSQKDEPAPKKDEVATSSSSKGAQAATRPAVTPPKSAWAATGGKGVAAAVAAAAPAPPAPVEAPANVATTITKPVANGTAAPAAAPAAAASSAAPAVEPSTSAPAPSKADEEGNWRARPKTETTAAPAPTPTPAPSVPKQAAPPPATNAWDLRRKVQPSAPTAAAPASLSNVASAATPLPQPSQVGAAPSSSAPPTSAPEPNGDAKASSSSKKAKKKGEAAAAADASLWPDVTQAAEAVKVAEGNKGKHEKKGSEVSGSGADEAPSSAAPGGKKQKWKAIPAAELQEAADKVAENHRKAKAKAQKAKNDADEAKSAKGKKGGAEHPPAKGQVRLTRSSSQGADTRRPPPPFGHPGVGASELRLGGAGADVAPSVIGSDKGVNGLVAANGNASTPMSRAGSQQSKRGSPSQVSIPLSPGGVEDRAARSSSTGTLPQTGFPSNSNASLPRPPRQNRDREGRGGSYGGGRGRGGYRSVPATPRLYGDLSPLQGNIELASLYRQGYAMPYGYFPVPAQFVVSGSFDPAQANYAGVPASFPRAAPPPAPVTQVPGLDPLRVYVLGQIEYYFSVQNLAMDFFLRQQMDSEGWIDTAMIASFNRIKQLVSDVALVTEVMTMSSLLEVKEDKVRLSGGAAKRWVLPDAKPSKFEASPAYNPSPKKSAGEGTEVSHGIPASMDASALGLEDLDLLMPTSPQPKFDVENALMKSSASTNISSAASALASDDAKTLTPTTTATSITEEADDVFEDKPKAGHE